jgi:hypothetical protein
MSSGDCNRLRTLVSVKTSEAVTVTCSYEFCVQVVNKLSHQPKPHL